jgi:cysteinyl-tRNA synthetase
MDNDLSTAQALTVLYNVLKYKTNDATKLASLADFDTVLGLGLLDRAEKRRAADEAAKKNASAQGGFVIEGEGDPDIDALVKKRAEAKKEKNFEEADWIREELKAKGIEVTDIPGGAKWKRI